MVSAVYILDLCIPVSSLLTQCILCLVIYSKISCVNWNRQYLGHSVVAVMKQSAHSNLIAFLEFLFPVFQICALLTVRTDQNYILLDIMPCDTVSFYGFIVLKLWHHHGWKWQIGR